MEVGNKKNGNSFHCKELLHLSRYINKQLHRDKFHNSGCLTFSIYCTQEISRRTTNTIERFLFILVQISWGNRGWFTVSCIFWANVPWHITSLKGQTLCPNKIFLSDSYLLLNISKKLTAFFTSSRLIQNNFARWQFFP